MRMNGVLIFGLECFKVFEKLMFDIDLIKYSHNEKCNNNSEQKSYRIKTKNDVGSIYGRGTVTST